MSCEAVIYSNLEGGIVVSFFGDVPGIPVYDDVQLVGTERYICSMWFHVGGLQNSGGTIPVDVEIRGGNVFPDCPDSATSPVLFQGQILVLLTNPFPAPIELAIDPPLFVDTDFLWVGLSTAPELGVNDAAWLISGVAELGSTEDRFVRPNGDGECTSGPGGDYFFFGGDPWAGFAVKIEAHAGPFGACCVAGECTIETPADCSTQGGTYQGDNTTCTPNPCPLCVAEWEAMPPGVTSGANNRVLAAIVFEGDLIVGGEFTSIGGVAANRVARWDGIGWQPMGGGLGGGGTLAVTSFAIYNDELYAGGNFTSPNRMAKWNPITSVWDAVVPGGGPNSTVDALTVYNGELIASGNFTTIGNPVITVNRIARWDGSAWQPFQVGGNVGVSGRAFGLNVFNGELIVGGDFTTAGGTSANRIARWTGSSWSPLSSGTSSAVRKLNIINDQLIATGDFTTAGGVTVNRIARWDGTMPVNWQGFGTGLDGRGRPVMGYGADLLVGGDFTTAGGVSAAGLALWDELSQAWSEFGGGVGGVNPHVYLLFMLNERLIVGGDFESIGALTVNRIARLDDCAACCLPAGKCADMLQSECVGMGGTPQPAGVTCAQEPCLAGCKTCDGDTNGDGQVDALDVQGMVDCIVVGTPCACTDLDGDGFTADVDTADDLDAFVTKLLTQPDPACP